MEEEEEDETEEGGGGGFRRAKTKNVLDQNVLDPEQLENHENIKIKNKTMKTSELPELKMFWI